MKFDRREGHESSKSFKSDFINKAGEMSKG